MIFKPSHFILTAFFCANVHAGTRRAIDEAIKISCPEIGCLLDCTSGYQLDARRCPTCTCIDPCEHYVCKVGQICQTVEVQCVKAPCYPVAKCVSACPQIKCSVKCLSGYRRGLKGCQTCQCVDPCEGYVCEVGQVCKPVDVVCKSAPCYPVAECVPDCPQVKCSTVCQVGTGQMSVDVRRVTGVDPCEEAICPDGEVCKPIEVECFAAPCYNDAQCVVECPLKKCLLFCESGYQLDVNGCETCLCLNPCEGTLCEEGQVCKVVEAQCMKDPCYPVAECVYDCPQVRCSTVCQSGFRVDGNGCQSCNCIDPCEEAQCPEGEVCQSLPTPCLPPPSPCYNAAVCTKECPKPKCIPCLSGYLFDENNCQTCECVDRCERVTCPPGQVCKEVQVDCIKAPCYNLGECFAARK
uniref:Cys-rich cocoon protein n=1 Tax=Theromyzon rude TaxID=60934 RepID=Q6QJ04_9ANNE|nr:cys-rich cocoon protein [Theromyzon rude]